MNGFLEGLKALGLGRLMAMGAVALAMLGLLAMLMLHGPTEHMALLYSDLDPREAGQIVDVLDHQHVPHQLAHGGAEILVPDGQVAQARLLLAKSGLPSGGSIGFGLGTMLNQSRELADLAGVLATILLILAIGIVIELVLFGPIERRMLRNRGLLLGGTR